MGSPVASSRWMGYVEGSCVKISDTGQTALAESPPAAAIKPPGSITHRDRSCPMNSTVPEHAANTMNHIRNTNTFQMYTHDVNSVLTNRAPDLNLLNVRSGRMPRMARTPPSPLIPPEIKSRHTKDTQTIVPSMTFHPSFRYALSPNSKPCAIILMNISSMKRNVKKMSKPSRVFLYFSTSSGSYRNAISKQFAMIANKMKLFQSLWPAIAMHCLRGNSSLLK